ncbi:MAG: hypothetical protein Q8O67_25810 [Deltaproteobacteria bacterium]|nr:hypothetical protein [Deltaproteobacteria bacterium]
MRRLVAIVDRFSLDHFERAASRKELCLDLQTTLDGLIDRGDRFHASVMSIVERLRLVGHDLWSFDEEEEYEIWCPDYSRGQGRGLILTFRVDGPVEVDWSDH